MNRRQPTRLAQAATSSIPLLLLAAALLAAFPLLAKSYLLFHGVAEIAALTISFGTFLFAWNTRRYQNPYLLTLGIGALFVGAFETLHCLAFPGMGVFTGYDTVNLSPQLWLGARYMQASSLLLGLLLLNSRPRPFWLTAGFGSAFALVATAIFLGHVPEAVDAAGRLTRFKVGAEALLVAAFAASAFLLLRVRGRFSPRVHGYLVANSVIMVGAEIAFTLYASPYDFANFLGHVFLVSAVWLQYRAVLRTGLTDPGEAHFRDLVRLREDAERAVRRLAVAESGLREANERLLDADRRKNEFIAVLSHELRNPLAPIRASVFVLERAGSGSEQAKAAYAVINRQVGNLVRLIDELLDVTRISRGKMRIVRETIHLNTLVVRVGEDHRPVFAERRIEFDVRVDGETLSVHGDATRLEQVLNNLLANAAKFTPGGGRVTLSLEIDDEGPASRHAIVRVADTGAGLTPDGVKHIFEPFVQSETTIERSRAGLGLGLALVKGLVELHGGTISATSPGPGLGSEFTVRIPIVPESVGPGSS